MMANRHPSYVRIVNNSHLKDFLPPPHAKNTGTMGDRIEVDSVGTSQRVFHSLGEDSGGQRLDVGTLHNESFSPPIRRGGQV